MRILTFRFDDGLWVGTQKAIKILGGLHASFFIVRDWLSDYDLPIRDEYNKGRDHGSIDSWTKVSLSGHDVQAHSCTHSSFSTLSSEERAFELNQSLQLIQQIHSAPYAMCYPYNDITPDQLSEIGYQAAGFHTRPSDQAIHFNDLQHLDLYHLKSWAIRENHLEDIKIQLESLPDNTWTILALHSLDGEGWEPWSEHSFSELVNFLTEGSFEVLSLSETLKQLLQEK